MRAVLQVFENYQKARVNFVQTVAELAGIVDIECFEAIEAAV